MKLFGITLVFSILTVVGLLGASLTEAFPDDRSTLADKDARPERLSSTESAHGHQQNGFARMAAEVIGALVERELPGMRFKPSTWIRPAEKIVAALPAVAPEKVYTAIPAQKITAALSEIPSEKIYPAIPAEIYKSIPATKIGPVMIVKGSDPPTLEPTIPPNSTTTSIPTTSLPNSTTTSIPTTSPPNSTTTTIPTTLSPTTTPTEGPTVEPSTTPASTTNEPPSTTPPVTTSASTTTQVPTELPTPSPKKHHGLSKGEVAALVCFLIIIIGIIAGGVIYFVRKRRMASESYTRLVQ